MNNSSLVTTNGKTQTSVFDDPAMRSFMVEVVYRCLGIFAAWIRKRYGLRE